MEETKEQAPDTACGTIVITMDLKTGKMAIQGNVLPDVDLTLRMLLEAAHTMMRQDSEANPDDGRRLVH